MKLDQTRWDVIAGWYAVAQRFQEERNYGLADEVRFFATRAYFAQGRPAIHGKTVLDLPPIPWTVFRLRRLMFLVFAYLHNLTPQASLTPQAGEGVPSMFDSWEVKVLYQPDGGEG